MKILLVKLSSLGDILHNLPVVWDIRAKYPDAQIDWAVEEAYVDLLEPLRMCVPLRGVDNIIAVCLRRLKKRLWQREDIDAFMRSRRRLRAIAYDLVIETQGLIKSAAIGRLARLATGGVIVGPGNKVEHAAYEAMTRWFYTNAVRVPRQCHAVDLARYIAASAIGTPPPDRSVSPPRFYPEALIERLLGAGDEVPALLKPFSQAMMGRPYALCIHATAGPKKTWARESWVALGRELARQGIVAAFPWGTASEKLVSESLAGAIPHALVVPKFSLQEAFALSVNAKLTIGVDTGLTHLSAVLGRPTIELFCAPPRTRFEGYWSPNVVALGDAGKPPSVEEVLTRAMQMARLVEFSDVFMAQTT